MTRAAAELPSVRANAAVHAALDLSDRATPPLDVSTASST